MCGDTKMEVLDWAVGAKIGTEVVALIVVTDTSDISTEDNCAESPPSIVGSNLPVDPRARPLRLVRLRRLSPSPRRLLASNS